MTSIYNIPYEDIKIFLLANNINIANKNKDYDKALILLKDKKSKGHSISIIEWMMAHNLLINKANISNYTNEDIDNMSLNQINKLSKLLGMKGNNPNNIKNILRYLNKLDDENISLLPEINDIILNTLSDIEKTDKEILLLIKSGSFRDIIDLLRTHYNKKIIRELILDNMEEIVDNLSRDNLILFIIELINNNELGLAKKFYSYLNENRSGGFMKNLNSDIFDSIYNQYSEYNILQERLFKIISSFELFRIFRDKVNKIKNVNYKLGYYYVLFLEIAIKLQKIDLIILLLDFFKENTLVYKVNSVESKTLQEFEDLLAMAQEMI